MESDSPEEKSEPIRLALALPSLALDGGAERVMLTLIKHIDRRRFAPMLIVVDQDSADISRLVPPGVPVYNLGVKRVRYAPLPLIRLLYQVRADVLLTGLGHLNLMVAMIAWCLPARLMLIGRETSVVTAMNRELGMAGIRNAAYRIFYPRLDRVICQSRDMYDDLTGTLGFPADRAELIHNPVDVDVIRARAILPLREPSDVWSEDCPLKLLAVGRLAPQKGFDLLIAAIALLPALPLELLIIGQGELRAELVSQIDALGLHGRVRLVGYQENPYAFMAKADAVVLSSRYEGLPNVVLEALACGTPVLATPAPGGLAEIAGLVAGIRLAEAITPESLAFLIESFCFDGRDRPSPDASRFSTENIIPLYEDLIAEAVGRTLRLEGDSKAKTSRPSNT